MFNEGKIFHVFLFKVFHLRLICKKTNHTNHVIRYLL